MTQSVNPPPTSFTQSKTWKQAALIVIIAITGLGLFFVFKEYHQVKEAIRLANWRMLPAAFLLTFLGYSAMGYSYALVCRAYGIRMPVSEMAAVGYVTILINHIVTAGGVAGFGIRYLMMARYDVSMKDVIASSLMHYYLTSQDMVIMLPISLGYLIFNTTVPRGISVILWIIAIFLTIYAIVAIGLLFSTRWREPVIAFLVRVGYRLFKKDFHEILYQFHETMENGAQGMRKNPLTLPGVVLLTILEWIAAIYVLSFCLEAFGNPVPVGVVITGFVIGIIIGVMSMVPGGYGIQEGSVTGVLVMLKVPFEQAILGAVLFRLVFYIIPYLLSLGFYKRLMQGVVRV